MRGLFLKIALTLVWPWPDQLDHFHLACICVYIPSCIHIHKHTQYAYTNMHNVICNWSHLWKFKTYDNITVACAHRETWLFTKIKHERAKTQDPWQCQTTKPKTCTVLPTFGWIVGRSCKQWDTLQRLLLLNDWLHHDMYSHAERLEGLPPKSLPVCTRLTNYNLSQDKRT